MSFEKGVKGLDWSQQEVEEGHLAKARDHQCRAYQE